MMETHLRSLLLSDSALMALVADRVDWGLRPQGDSLPAVRLTIVSDGSIDHSLDGPGLSRARVQIDCFAATYGGAKVVGNAVRSLLDGYRDSALAGVFMAGARDLQDGEGDLTVQYVSTDFFVTYTYNP